MTAIAESILQSVRSLFLRDGVVKIGALVFGLSLVALATERIDPGAFAGRFAPYVDPVLLLTTLAALLYRRSRVVERRERRFWDLVALAWGCLLAVEFFYFSELSLPFISASFATDLLHILYYLVLALALDLRPHVRPARSLAMLRQRLESVAGLVGFFGVLIYFGLVVLPEPLGLSLSFVSRETGFAPFLLLRLSLDLFILGRLLYASFTSSGRWPGLYRLLAAALLLLTVRDGLALLRYTGILTPGSLGIGHELLLCLPGFLVLLAARLRLAPTEAAGEISHRVASENAHEMSRTSLLALYALIVPVAHFLLYPLGLLEIESRTVRDVFGLIYVLVVGSIAVVHQLLLDKERRQAVESLHHEIEERERINRKLSLRQAEAEQFNYTISHELQAPLVTIGGFVGLLEGELKRQDSANAMRDLDRIRTAANHMSDVLQELLELSRVGWRIEPTEDLAMTPVVEEAIYRLEVKHEARKPRIVIETELPTVRADAARITDVFTNLIDNAVKFTPPDRRPEIWIGYRPGPDAAFYVADNGSGVEPRFHTKIFGLFDRLDPGVQGTGVGLALVKRIIEGHSGRVWVESAGRGQGSTFYFTLGRTAA